MPTSKHIHSSIRLFYLVLLAVFSLGIWFSQNSINAYWQQTYHQDSPLTSLDRYQWWTTGSLLQQNANEFYAAQKAQWENLDLNVLFGIAKQQDDENAYGSVAQVLSENVYLQNLSFFPPLVVEQEEKVLFAPEKEESVQVVAEPPLPESTDTLLVKEPIKNKASNETHEQLEKVATTPSNAKKETVKGKFASLKAGDEVFLAGDSLMQGVAPHIQKWLKSEHKIQSYNLSKQSTGLSYPSFFDWPKTIEDNLKQHPNIRLLVVFLGPNDPWDFPDPQKPSKYLKFQSPEWETVYKQRIERILNSAKKYNVQVIWLGVPHMKKTKLNDQMAYLNRILNETTSRKALLLPTENLLSEGKDTYLDSIFYNGKKTRVRSKDGIHFSLEGQRILAEYVQQHISVQ